MCCATRYIPRHAAQDTVKHCETSVDDFSAGIGFRGDNSPISSAVGIMAKIEQFVCVKLCCRLTQGGRRKKQYTKNKIRFKDSEKVPNKGNEGKRTTKSALYSRCPLNFERN